MKLKVNRKQRLIKKKIKRIHQGNIFAIKQKNLYIRSALRVFTIIYRSRDVPQIHTSLISLLISADVLTLD